MSIVRTLIGNIKGPAGATGATGATGAAGANGADGAAATVNVGTVSTTAYGNPAQVINSGTESAAVLDFVIPQGQPGEEVTDMAGLTLGTMTTQTSQFPTPQIGDNGATLWGKVVKYFSDLRTAIGTKLNTANVVNNFTTTEAGYALDARAGKTLNDNLNDRLNGVCFKRLAPATTSTVDTFTASGGGERHILYAIDSGPTRCAAWFVFTAGNGTIGFAPIVSASGMTVDISNNALTITHTAGTPAYVDMCLNGVNKFLTIS